MEGFCAHTVSGGVVLLGSIYRTLSADIQRQHGRDRRGGIVLGARLGCSYSALMYRKTFAMMSTVSRHRA